VSLLKPLIRSHKALDVLAGFFWPTFEFPKALRVEAVVPAGDFLQMRAQEYLEDLMHAFIFKGLMLILVATANVEEYEGPWIQFDSEAWGVVNLVFSVLVFFPNNRKRRRSYTALLMGWVLEFWVGFQPNPAFT
jgi:hypothetical protein